MQPDSSRTRALSRIGCALLALASSSCYVMRFSRGGGQTEFDRPVQPRAEAIALVPGYRIEPIVTGLTFPSAVTFDGEGRPCIVEAGYCYGEVFTKPRLLRLESDGRLTTLATGRDNGPWTGCAWSDGDFYVAEGGVLEGGRILRIDERGTIEALIEDLPSRGDHHTNGPAVGPDGKLYFAIGTATNAGVVGEDSAKFGGLARAPDFHDIPGADIVLRGSNFTTKDALGRSGGEVSTGAYMPYGTPTRAGQMVRGRTICTGSVLRMPKDGGDPELVAWGLRNPFGLAFAPDGALYVTENGYDERGSRPVWGSADHLWRIEPGRWYGWPDFSGGLPVSREDFDPPGGPAPHRLLAKDPERPPLPVASFACHSSADGLDFSRNPEFGYVGDAFVALFGDQVPATGKLLAPVGYKVVRVELDGGVIEDFAVNRAAENGPGSRLGTQGFERPIDVRFDPSGRALYVVDFGALTYEGKQEEPHQGTGVLWRITRSAGGATAKVLR
jgi:glucose/arabinose dehydrogenase